MANTKSPSKQGVELAKEFRIQHSLGNAPVHDITSLMKLVPADFIILDLPRGLDALALRDPQTGATTVGIGTTASPYRQRMTVAHEIAHILSGDIDNEGDAFICEKSSPEETRANTFARCLLCPEEGLKELAPQQDSLALLSETVRIFQVSPFVAAVQLEHAELITEEEKESFLKLQAPALASKYGWKAAYDRARAISTLEQPSERLVADAYEAYAQGLIALPTVAFAEQVSIEESAQSVAAAAELNSFTLPNTPSSVEEVFAELDDFFDDEDD